jgi:phage tail-like protein
MRLQQIKAVPHPAGNRIDLAWRHPDPSQFSGVRVVRREGTHPTSPRPASAREGIVVADTNPASPQQGKVEVGQDGLYHAADVGLKGETVYYYALFPYALDQDPPVYQSDRHNRAAAMATAPYAMAGQMFELLPTIYHRYDTVLPRPNAVVPDADRHKGQLRRFLELPGSQLDQLYSLARAVLDLHDLEKVDGRLLPLLAQWIGWPTDYRLEVGAQRHEIRNAPHLYKAIGLIPTVEATVKRTLGLESRTKEFVHNVFRSNQPERLNLWIRLGDQGGAWSEPTTPLSLDFAYEGRPTAVRDSEGTLWLFYHTLKKGQWDIWYKTSRDDQGWAPSQPLTSRRSTDKYPTAVVQRTTLWVFWSSYDEAKQRWQINFRTRTDGQWSATAPLPSANPDASRRQPWAVVDDTDGLWLFWRELVGAQWQLKYNRHDGTIWASASGIDFPSDDGKDPRVDGAPFVLFHPTETTQRLWVFWARKEPTDAPNQTRWRIVYRAKDSLDPDAGGWGPIRALPPGRSDSHDRDPTALPAARWDVELFWSSNRGDSWSIWHGTLNPTRDSWGTLEPISSKPYSEHDPLPVALGPETLLIYRSNESLLYASTIYGATETVDARYAGCTTVDTRNRAKIRLRGRFEDFQTYTYDAGLPGQRTERDWYARDTVGMYIPAGATEQSVIGRSQRLLADVLRQFLPIQVRAVFIVEPTQSVIEGHDCP